MDCDTVCDGKDVLVTGAGGYIGSALVKAIAAAAPRSLTLLDSSEQNLFEIRRLLNAEFPTVYHQAVVGSVSDGVLLDGLFSESQVEVVFHAAAFKHVELMELNPFAALLNNAVGTFLLAQCALAHQCKLLLLISTDKAVRPHSIMGVSKRLAEMAVVSLSRPETRMSAIRLCNIKGSSGSVLPILLQQMRVGRPHTITDPDATRCFMSLEEAVTAILDAAARCCDGRILLPYFTPPVRIADLANSLNNGCGVYPFEVIGLRPGEKMSEDFVGPDETFDSDSTDTVRILHAPRLDPAECEQLMRQLQSCIDTRNRPELLRLLAASIPEYVPSELFAPCTCVAGKA